MNTGRGDSKINRDNIFPYGKNLHKKALEKFGFHDLIFP